MNETEVETRRSAVEIPDGVLEDHGLKRMALAMKIAGRDPRTWAEADEIIEAEQARRAGGLHRGRRDQRVRPAGAGRVSGNEKGTQQDRRPPDVRTVPVAADALRDAGRRRFAGCPTKC